MLAGNDVTFETWILTGFFEAMAVFSTKG